MKQTETVQDTIIEIDVPLNSPAIERLLEEIKINEIAGIPNAYNRVYNRHNRS